MTLLPLIQHYGYVGVFVGTFLEGETILLAAAYAAHRGYLDPPLVAALALTGCFLGDQTFFWIGRRWGNRLLTKFPGLAPRIARMDALLNRHHLPIIMIMRFLYGLRIAGPIAIGMSRLGGLRFLCLNLLSAVAWTTVIGAAGYGLGAGTLYLLSDVTRYDERLLMAILGAGLVFRVVAKWRSLRTSPHGLACMPVTLSTRFHQFVLAQCPDASCRAQWAAGSISTAIGIVALHHLSGSHPAFFILLLLPTLMATLRLGLVPGLAIAIFGAGLMLWSDLRMASTASPLMLIFNAGLRLSVFVLITWGAWKIVDLSRMLHALSHTDSLTQLGNHRAFMSRGEEEIQRARRGALPLTVLFIDLDNFKSVNDTYGHDAGDALLKKVAKVLGARLRHSDFAARLGGDEFGVILYATEGSGAHVVAEQIHGDLRASFKISGHPVSASIGAVTFREAPERFDEALKQADALMYEVKRSSKDAILHREILTPNGVCHD